MFCPEGYVSLYDTVLAFEQIAFEWWAQKGAAIEQAEHDANKENYLRQYGNLSGYVDFGLGSGPVKVLAFAATF